MCVIGVYRKSIPFNYDEMDNCFTRNKDGAGVMWNDGHTVHIRKGFMEKEKFIEFLKTLPVDCDRVIHCRIATAGKVSPECCHPFPVSPKYEEMRLLDTTVTWAFAHNGVLHSYNPQGGLTANYSDSMAFGKRMLNELLVRGLDLHDSLIEELLSSHIGYSKLAVMNKDNVSTIGDFEQSLTSKATYSNSSYKKQQYSRYGGYNYGSYGYYGYSSQYGDTCGATCMSTTQSTAGNTTPALTQTSVSNVKSPPLPVRLEIKFVLKDDVQTYDKDDIKVLLEGMLNDYDMTVSSIRVYDKVIFLVRAEIDEDLFKTYHFDKASEYDFYDTYAQRKLTGKIKVIKQGAAKKPKIKVLPKAR